VYAVDIAKDISELFWIETGFA